MRWLLWCFCLLAESYETINHYHYHVSSNGSACPGDLTKASISVIVGGKVLTALVDSGSSESYIHSSICSKLNLTLYPSLHQVRMASTSVKGEVVVN